MIPSIASQLVSQPGHSIFVWLPVPAATGFLPSAGARVFRESSKIVSLLASLAAINNKYPVKTGRPVLSVEALNFFCVLHHGSQTKTIFTGTIMKKRNSERFC